MLVVLVVFGAAIILVNPFNLKSSAVHTLALLPSSNGNNQSSTTIGIGQSGNSTSPSVISPSPNSGHSHHGGDDGGSYGDGGDGEGSFGSGTSGSNQTLPGLFSNWFHS